VNAPRPLSWTALHQRELARDPWVWLVAALLPTTALAWRALAPEVGVMSTFGVAALLLPPAVLALTAPRLARASTWAFWGSLALRPAAAYRGAIAGSTLGLLPPLLAGAAAAALLVRGDWTPTLALLLAVAGVVVFSVALAGFTAAATQDPARAVAAGALVWALLVIAYEPLLVALALAFADRPFEPILAALILANPLEVARVALLRALDTPVFAGPTGLLLERWWGAWAPWWAAVSTFAFTLALAGAAGVLLWRRPR
jgi:hypothetical protein